MQAILICAVGGYALGSIPFGYLLVRVFRGADIRTTGSGNIGATNVSRTSPVLGVMTLVLDTAKGMAAVVFALAIFPENRALAFVAALAAVCGHIFPVWLKFRGGKGVATGLGVFLLLLPKTILAALGIFILVLAGIRFVALGSIVAAATLPIAALMLGETRNPTELALTAAVCLLIIFKHHQNIGRMLAGKEPRFRVTRT